MLNTSRTKVPLPEPEPTEAEAWVATFDLSYHPTNGILQQRWFNTVSCLSDWRDVPTRTVPPVAKPYVPEPDSTGSPVPEHHIMSEQFTAHGGHRRG